MQHVVVANGTDKIAFYKVKKSFQDSSVAKLYMEKISIAKGRIFKYQQS